MSIHDLPLEQFHSILWLLQVHQVIGISRVSTFFKQETEAHLKMRSNRLRRRKGTSRLHINVDAILTPLWYMRFGSRPLHDAMMYSNIHDLHFDFGAFNDFERHYPYQSKHVSAWLQFVYHSWHQFQPISNEVFSLEKISCTKDCSIIYRTYSMVDIEDKRTMYMKPTFKRTRLLYFWNFLLQLSNEKEYPDHYRVIYDFVNYLFPDFLFESYVNNCEKRIAMKLTHLFGENFHNIHIEGRNPMACFGMLYFRRAIARRLIEAAVMSTYWKWYNPHVHTWQLAAETASPFNHPRVVDSIMSNLLLRDLIKLTAVSKSWQCGARKLMQRWGGDINLTHFRNCQRFNLGAQRDGQLYLRKYAPRVSTIPYRVPDKPNPTWERYKHETSLEFKPFNPHAALRIMVEHHATIKFVDSPDDSFYFLEHLHLEGDTAIRRLREADIEGHDVEERMRHYLTSMFPSHVSVIDQLIMESDNGVHSINPINWKRLFDRFGLSFNPRYWPSNTRYYLLESYSRSECFLKLMLLLRLLFTRNARMSMSWNHFDPRIYTWERAVDVNWGFNLMKYHSQDVKPCVAQ